MTSGAATIRRALDVPDLIEVEGVIRLRLGYAFGVGRRTPIPDQEVALVDAGRIVAVVTTCDGEAELPATESDGLGVFRVRERTATELAAAVERSVAIIRPGASSLILFDAELDAGELGALCRSAEPAGPELLAVRVRPVRSCRAVRARLRTAGLAARVVDASAVLDEGPAVDVGEALDAVRLARVGARLRAAGYPVVAIVHRAPHAPATLGFEALRAEDVAAQRWVRPSAPPRAASLEDRLDALAGAARFAGNRVDAEVDNATARRWLFDAVEGAVRRIHLQVYMASDDDLGRDLAARLAAAGERGVTVRVLVDSLHTLHDVFGARNPLLDRLAAAQGVEVRVSHPIVHLPSLEDLKQRDHRKLIVVDGRSALVGGRNLAHEYYTGFDEVSVTAKTAWREVPWLDAGARVEGPAVAALDRAFLEAWRETGGAPFDVEDAAPAGTTPIRLVLHRGLRDAATLEAYLALIDTARSYVHAVNGFPLLLELQHALVRAVRRGVRVRTLFGHVTPTHAGEPFDGTFTAARVAATELVHSRMDALVAAGGEAYMLALRDLRGWAPGLGLVHPHVHAKIVSADGRVCALGSANLDLTSSYWESEILLVVEDERVVHRIVARIQELIAGSVRLDREDPTWQRLARRREWLRRWPGVLSV